MTSTPTTARAAAEAPPAASTASRTSLAGGVAVITVAKVWFVVAGYALYFGLTRLLGPDGFGLYAVAISVVSVVNNVLVAATLQSVSRFVAAAPERSGAVLRQATRVQVVLGAGIFLVLLLSAPFLSRWFRDAALTTPLRIAALISFAYAMYAALVGYLNGLRRFSLQAGLDITFSTLKTGLALVGAGAGLGVVGAVAGFAAAAWIALGLAAVAVLRQPRPGGAFAVSDYLGFGGWLLALTTLANLVLSADLWVVKRLAEPLVANREAGLFRAALTLSQLLYQLLIPLSLVVFPSLAQLSADEPEARRRVVRGALRYLVAVTAPAATVLAILGPELVSLLYGPSYESGGRWLAILAPAYALWTGASLVATALAGAGHPRRAVALLGAGLVVQVLLAVLFFPRWGTAGVALGDALGMGFAFLLGLGLALREFGDVLPWRALANALVLSLLLAAVAAGWPATGLLFLVKLAALGLLALVGLYLGRELDPLLSRWRRGREGAA